MAGIFSDSGIFYPVALHLLLLLFLFVMVSVKRMSAVREQAVHKDDFAYKTREPEHSRRWANNLNNQFELPLLFHALVALLIASQAVNEVYIMLAWVFVVGRFAHTAVQVGTDNVTLRGMVFMVNFLALALMWLYFLYQTLVLAA